MALKFQVQEVIQNIDEQWNYLLYTRSLIPHTKGCKAGVTKIQTAPYYKSKGYEATIIFSKNLNKQELEKINYIGHWVNQGFVIRLIAYLEYCRVYTPKESKEKITIDQEIVDWKKVDIARRLRNYFAHGRVHYKPQNDAHKKTYDTLVDIFGLNPAHYPEKDDLFPIPIDEVLQPMVEGCKNYITTKYNVDS